MGTSQPAQYDWATFDDDESIIWNGHPRAISTLKYALVFTVIGAGFFFAGRIAGIIGIAAATILSGIVYKRTVNTDYVLTDKRLYRKTGVLAESTESAPLRQIQNTSLSKDILGSRRGYGTVSVSTAAGAGDIRITNIDDPSAFKQQLTRHIEAASSQSDSRQGATDETLAALDALANELNGLEQNLELLNDELSDE